MEEKDMLVTLIDDETGEEVDFDLLLTFEYEGERYVALEPMDTVENIEEGEVVILEIVKKNGQETYKSIDNEILLDELFHEFQELFDAEDEEEEEDE